MRIWWQQRNPREQGLLILALTAFIALSIYIGIWEPWQDRLNSKRAQIAQLQTDLNWLQAATSKFHAQLSSGAPVTANQSLASIIEQSTANTTLKSTLQGIEARNQDIQIMFNAVPFDALLLWLQGLVQKHGISVKQANIESTLAAGKVNARLVLQRMP